MEDGLGKLCTLKLPNLSVNDFGKYHASMMGREDSVDKKVYLTMDMPVKETTITTPVLVLVLCVCVVAFGVACGVVCDVAQSLDRKFSHPPLSQLAGTKCCVLLLFLFCIFVHSESSIFVL